MKKFLFVLFVVIFASSASASVYKWVDERGVANFSDDYDKVPPQYRHTNSSQTFPEEIRVSAKSANPSAKVPPVAQPLVREGDFAIKLVEALKLGRPESEAEAESLLASVGIAPRNGWIADYPVTPDIIGELENVIGEAADAGRLPMGRNEALKAFRTAALELELPIIAEIPDRYDEAPPPTAPQYTEPYVINNYYYSQGPPVITYYPPPPDYYYLYAWIPSPFWYFGFYFPGYYILHDFHRVIYISRRPMVITNHIRDHRTGRIFTIHPERRHEGRTFRTASPPPSRGFSSPEARNSARSIFDRSRDRMLRGNVNTSIKDQGINYRHSPYSRPSQSYEKQVYSGESRSSGIGGRSNDYGRPPISDSRMARTPNENASPNIHNRNYGPPNTLNRKYGRTLQEPLTGETRSFSPPANPPERGGGRSFSSTPQSGVQSFNSPPMGNRGFYGFHPGGHGGFSPPAMGNERSFSTPSQGGGRFFNHPSGGNRSFLGGSQGDRGGFLGFGGPHF